MAPGASDVHPCGINGVGYVSPVDALDRARRDSECGGCSGCEAVIAARIGSQAYQPEIMHGVSATVDSLRLIHHSERSGS